MRIYCPLYIKCLNFPVEKQTNKQKTHACSISQILIVCIHHQTYFTFQLYNFVFIILRSFNGWIKKGGFSKCEIKIELLCKRWRTV